MKKKLLSFWDGLSGLVRNFEITSAVYVTVSLLFLATFATAAPSAKKYPGIARFSNAETLYSTENAISVTDKKRCKVVREQSFKYPLIRIDETITSKGNAALMTNLAAEETVQRTEMVADHMIVKLKKGANRKSLEDICERKQFSIRQQLKGSQNLFLVAFDVIHANSIMIAIDEMKKEADLIEYAEPDYIVHASLSPDDPKFTDGTLWGMNKISAPDAWDISTGSNSVLVGVIDTGVDYNHEDLIDNIWTNAGEIPGNGIDDDGNGFIDDVHGWDAVNNDGDPMDDHYHGTHCSGTIGGVGNNGTAIVGVNWKVGIMGLKFLDAGGSGDISDAVVCLNYATLMHADLTSNSWGGGGFSQSMKDALDANGKLFIAAAGNDGSDNDTTPSYPSNYDCANIVAVAATDSSDVLAYFSNYGLTTVDLAAPGVDVYSSTPSNSYEYLSGTSMATPHVAGAAALLLSVDQSFTAAQLKAFLMDSTDPITGLSGKCVTGGRLNVFKALQSLTYLKVLSPSGGEIWRKGDSKNITWSSHGLTGNVKIQLMKNGAFDSEIAADTENDGLYSWTVPFSLANAADYRIRITAVDDSLTADSNADFAINDVVYSLAMAVSPEGVGSTSPTGVKDVLPGTSYDISATPNQGYYFSGWTATANASISAPLSANTTVTVVGNATVTANFAQYQVFFSQDFESGQTPPDDWTIVDGASSPGEQPAHWTTSYSYNHTESGSYAGVSSWGYNLDERLNSPTVDLSSVTGPILSFWWCSSYYWHVSPNDNGDLFVEISKDGGATWTRIWTFGDIGTWQNWTWYNTRLDLSEYVGEKNVKISFHVVASDNADIAVDDIELLAKTCLKVLSPAGGEVWKKGDTKDITWSSHGLSQNVKIQLLRNGVFYSEIAADTENDGVYSWAVPFSLANAADYRIRITAADDSLTADSNADFGISDVIFTLAMAASPAGAGLTSPTGVKDVVPGTSYNIAATPDVGYDFTRWTVTANASVSDPWSASTTVILVGDATVTANFAIKTYSLNYTAGSNGSIDGTTPQTVNHGGNGTEVTAVPDANCHFVSWSDGVMTASRTDTNVTADITAVANFALSRQLTIVESLSGATGMINWQNNSTGESGSGLGSNTFGAGDDISISVVPAAGYAFAGWTYDSNISVTNVSGTDIRFNLLDNATVTANFFTIKTGYDETVEPHVFNNVGIDQGWSSDDASWVYNLPFTFTFYGIAYNSVNVCSNGFLDFASNSASYSNSDSALIQNIRIALLWQDLVTSIYITENTDNVIIRWAGVVFGSSNPVNFEVVLYRDGRIQFNYGDGNAGISPTIGLSAGNGLYYDLASHNNQSDLTNVDSLLFTPKALPTVNITMECSPTDTGTTIPGGSFTRLQGTSFNISATPEVGYVFTNWTGACAGTLIFGNSLSSDTTANAVEDATITANFAVKTYTLTYTASLNGSITGTSPQTVNHGGNGTEVTALPDANCYFISRSDGVMTASRTDANVTADIAVVANFAPIPGEIEVTDSISPSTDLAIPFGDVVVGEARTETITVKNTDSQYPLNIANISLGSKARATALRQFKKLATATRGSSTTNDKPSYRKAAKAQPHSRHRIPWDRSQSSRIGILGEAIATKLCSKPTASLTRSSTPRKLHQLTSPPLTRLSSHLNRVPYSIRR
ncbi:MAG: S8 family serine peptidase [Victivallales bacterium]|jgi:subtilisin family serine protease